MSPKSNSNIQPSTSPLSSNEARLEETPATVQPDAAQPDDATDVEAAPVHVQPDAAQPDDATAGASSSLTPPSAFTDVPAPSSFTDYGRIPDSFYWQQKRIYFQRRTKSIALLVGGASIILGVGALAFIITQPGIPRKSIWIIGVCIIVALILLYCVPVFLNTRKWLKEAPEPDQMPERDGSHKRGRDSFVPQDGRDDERTNNQILIDKYHELTTQQAATSYRNSQYAMAVGLVLLVVGAVFAVRSTSGSAQLVVGVLTGLGTTLSAYLGKTFIHTYERALLQMNYYFGQPLVTSYILEAERLSGKLSKNKRDEALSAIISQTLLGASNASQALSPGSEDQASKPDSRGLRSVIKKDTHTEEHK